MRTPQPLNKALQRRLQLLKRRRIQLIQRRRLQRCQLPLLLRRRLEQHRRRSSVNTLSATMERDVLSIIGIIQRLVLIVRKVSREITAPSVTISYHSNNTVKFHLISVFMFNFVVQQFIMVLIQLEIFRSFTYVCDLL